MGTYNVVYDDGACLLAQTFHAVDVVRDEGWTIIVRGSHQLLYVRDAHVHALDRLDRPPTETHAKSDLTVSDVMRDCATTIEAHASLCAAAYVMKEHGDSVLVLTSDEQPPRVLALVTGDDIAQAIADGRKVETTRISDVTTTQPVVVDHDSALDHVADLMFDRGVHYLPVMRGTALVGIVDLGDVCRGLLRG